MKYLTSTTISPTLKKKELVGVGFFCLFLVYFFTPCFMIFGCLDNAELRR